MKNKLTCCTYRDNLLLNVSSNATSIVDILDCRLSCTCIKKKTYTHIIHPTIVKCVEGVHHGVLNVGCQHVHIPCLMNIGNTIVLICGHTLRDQLARTMLTEPTTTLNYIFFE